VDSLKSSVFELIFNSIWLCKCG